MSKIGRISNVSPRDAWNHEAHDFTPWLAENLDALSDVIGIELEKEGVEVSVGPYSADILAKDFHGRTVLIENQLEQTDHKHLGQILTYLSGLEAEIVIWLATKFSEPHLSAVSWLNENTSSNFSFFAIKLSVIKIADSVPAPIFEVLERPNEWDRQLKKLAVEKTGELSHSAIFRKEFWSHYLNLYPEDERLGLTINHSSSQWLRTDDIGEYVISIYLAKNEVGVFLRGNRGVAPSDIQESMKPHMDRFISFVGDLHRVGDPNHHPIDILKLDTREKENWDKAVEWLHNRSHSFLNGLSEVLS